MKDTSNKSNFLLKSIGTLREADDLSIQELSYLTGVDSSRLQGIEKGDIIPSVAELESILSAFCCHLGILDDVTDAIPSCLIENTAKKKKTVVILGNGFDLALGLNTSYSQFIASDYWPLKDGSIRESQSGAIVDSPLAAYIYNAVEVREWHDLESIIREFCNVTYNRYGDDYDYSEQDQVAFDIISKSLQSYLTNEQRVFLEDKARIATARRSTAFNVLMEELKSIDDVFVYSFNYTDTEKLAYSMDLEYKSSTSIGDWLGVNCLFHQIHSVIYTRKTIVLGIDEDCPMPKGLSFLRKMNNPGYIPSNILRDLADADKVVFFGHSLGDIDRCYFNDFYAKQSQKDLQPDESKEIVIYTLNEESGNSILTNIKEMQGVNLLHLSSNNLFSIQYTRP